jgi:hypothetical protein
MAYRTTEKKFHLAKRFVWAKSAAAREVAFLAGESLYLA